MIEIITVLHDYLIYIPIVIAVIIIYYAYYSLKIKLLERIEYTREFSDYGVFEGEEIIVIETIYNPSFLPLFYIDVESYIDANLRIEGREKSDAMQLIISRFHLAPHTQITRRHKIICESRGFYKMNTASIITKSLTIENSKYFNFNSELYVYPRLLNFIPQSMPINYMLGSVSSSHRVIYDPFSVTGIRDYVSGDPFNHINFKSTAKCEFQGLHSIKVNNFDYSSDRVFMIYMNFQPPEKIKTSSEYEKLMEYSISLAATIIFEAAKCGYRVGLAANCRLISGELQMETAISNEAFHFEKILRDMAKMRLMCGVSFASLIENNMKKNITNVEAFIISATSCIDNKALDGIDMLKKYNTVTVIRL